MVMESEAKHLEAPTEEAAVKSSGTLKKRQREWHLAAGRCGKPKEVTRGDCGSRRKLATPCRKLSRRARVAWRKRGVIRRDCMYQDQCWAAHRRCVRNKYLQRTDTRVNPVRALVAIAVEIKSPPGNGPYSYRTNGHIYHLA
jgi:hypothetical protein